MTLVKNILEFTEKIAPLDTQASWDNSGLLVGDLNREVKKVLVALDITKAVVKEAKALGCELIISHHPVIFSPLSEIDSDHIVYSLIKADICALCLHTNLDVAQNVGVNIRLAQALGLDDLSLYPDDFLCIGSLKQTLTDKQFAQYVKDCLNCNGVRYTNGHDIKTVAVCSGGGSDSIELDKKYNFDAIVTGEIKHHHFLYANEHNFCCVEAGHFNTEDVVVSPLVATLNDNFSEVSFVKSKALTDVVNFI
ncbi:MAG: Nif3-like dinuclear metal center hexameric protein [Ruminococcus sp.]|nr:Nif3-like dinuclear metal center hexameric protein [Ruminococcus sp.]